MIICRRSEELDLDRSKRIGFVPTMGSFHEGHLSLMRQARRENDSVAVSLFVNPTQFGQNEDLSRYPRNEGRDFELAEGIGVDFMFAPEVAEMYPSTGGVGIAAGDVGARFEGELRPGHFDGVATIVCKLLNIVRPNTAYFGRKDLQQCAVIARMVSDLNLPVNLAFCDTVREADGLAMSSRNVYLDPTQRLLVPQLFQKLTIASERIRGGKGVAQTLAASRHELQGSGFTVEYLDLVNPLSFQIAEAPLSPATIIAAVRLGGIRLIDNIPVFGIAF